MDFATDSVTARAPRRAVHDATEVDLTRWLDRAALGATLLLPIFLMHGRAVAEALIGVVDLCFLARSTILRDWSWLRMSWVRIALAFWAWLLVCSWPTLGAGGWASFAQAAALARFLLLPAALSDAVLASETPRRWLGWSLSAAAVYIAAQTLLQLSIGRDVQGFRRSGDGELTGPFQHPRAALPLSRLMLPALLPALTGLLDRRSILATAGAAALAVASLSLMVLIGQRMPLLQALLGFGVAGVLLPRLRGVAAAAILAAALLLATSAIVSPPAFHRLVTKFSAQMRDFPDSDYGLIAGRAFVIVAAHPVLGRGFDGFRDSCADPRYFHALAWSGARAADGGGVAACNIHPHSHYLEAATEAGLPGLALFTCLIAAWWMALLRGLGQDPDPLRVGLFATAFIHEWPIASAGSFSSVELSGFFFVLLGWGLAEARASGARRAREHVANIPRRFQADHVTGVP